MADSASLASSSDDLQFNTVESSANDTQGAAAERTCIGCHQPITSTYYALGEKLVCPTCRERVNTRPQGSGVVRFLKATVFGIGAAILGAVIWYVVRSAAHIESGLIAILVGFLVGKAVFIGSNNYGGLGYQLLAVLLTYCGIAGNYFPDAYEGTLNVAREQHQQAVAEQANAPAEAHNDRLAERDPTESPIVMALVIVFSVGISPAAPFLMGVENIIGILIIGFALWEAWKFNARRVLPITGPYQMGAAPAVQELPSGSTTGVAGWSNALTPDPPAIEVATPSCPKCATQLAPTMLVCPGCGSLVHAKTLSNLAESARQATERGEISRALSFWREALPLLPADSKQHAVISAKITELGDNLPPGATDSVQTASSAVERSPGMKAAVGLGAIGLAIWKLKAIFFGLTKGTTFLSMLLSLGVYWTVFGWKFALGLVLSIYVHEMGHVIALRRYGFQASAPQFIPGLGAFIRLQQKIVNPREDAEIGLAGPIYGLGAAVVCMGIWLVTDNPIFAVIAGVGAWVNLFNLMPFGTLDGGRGFHVMSRVQKLCSAATCGGAYALTLDGLLLLIALVGAGRGLGEKSDERGSWKAAITYCLLVVFLSAIAMIRHQVAVGN